MKLFTLFTIQFTRGISQLPWISPLVWEVCRLVPVPGSNYHCFHSAILHGGNKYMCCMCRYAKLEKGLGEIDRARAIYIHASAMADPRRDTEFWADWNAFEVIKLVYHYYASFQIGSPNPLFP